jgi:hypothetical protein
VTPETPTITITPSITPSIEPSITPTPTDTATPGADQCVITSFSVSPDSGTIGTTFTLSGSGECVGDVRAVRFSINGSPFGEFGGPSHSTPWGTDGLLEGVYRIGFHVAHSDWERGVSAYKDVVLIHSTITPSPTFTPPPTPTDTPSPTEVPTDTPTPEPPPTEVPTDTPTPGSDD